MELFHREGPAVVHALREAGVLASDASRADASRADASAEAGACAGPGASAGASAATLRLKAGGAGPDMIVTSSDDARGQRRSGDSTGAPGLFLDLKLHDIPSTVAGGMRSLLRLRPRFVTVHAAGGSDMVRAAVEAAGAHGTTEIAAVTVLTSLNDLDLSLVGLVGPAAQAARRLAALAVGAGARALVCSPAEVGALRREVGDGVTLITPGVRPEGSAQCEQARTATPRQALEAGSDLIVVGRPVTSAPDPKSAAAALVAGLAPA
jgi:orotidine-5'-phosphate decarboxylase